MNAKYIELTPALYNYIIAQRSQAGDPVLDALRIETEALGGISEMQISPEQGSFFTLLVGAIGAQRAIEVGTFTGYSALCIARGLAPGGKLHCFDRSEEWTAIARRYWEKAGVADKIELHLGDAATTIADLEDEAEFDFAFIDADKSGYARYYETILPRLRRNGLIVFDNMLRNGRIANENLENADDRALDALNKKLAADDRVESVLLPVADGLHICRKK